MLAFMGLWYVGIGMKVEQITVRDAEQACPGHTHAHDRWPMMVKTIRVAVWPLVLMNWPTDVYFDFDRVCDRFDVT